MIKRLLILVWLILNLSCNKQVRRDSVVYSNDFEGGDLTGITGGTIIGFNHTNVLGFFNAGGFSLSLSGLPEHDLLTVSFDLYIHDSWDGNKIAPDGPDLWELEADGGIYINTTFSNTPCLKGSFCSPQSYPADYPNSNHNPKDGAYRTDLPGRCSTKTDPHGTTEYRIVKTFKHTGSTLEIKCQDRLVQPNTADAKCDESWSVDNVTVKAVAL